MYIFQKTYDKPQISRNKVVLILPHDSTQISCFKKNVLQSIREVSGESECVILSGKEDKNRSQNKNYSNLYSAEKIIIEATDGKPNIFYMMGLAHALGKSVCVCYMEKRGVPVEIPFNVHGRQSVKYSVATVEYQKELREKLKDWLRNTNHD